MAQYDLVIKTYKIPENIAEEIEILSKTLGISQAAVVRFILIEYFNKGALIDSLSSTILKRGGNPTEILGDI
jgi:hypothetical protein